MGSRNRARPLSIRLEQLKCCLRDRDIHKRGERIEGANIVSLETLSSVS